MSLLHVIDGVVEVEGLIDVLVVVLLVQFRKDEFVDVLLELCLV